MEITFVTGNEKKLKEFKVILTDINFNIQKLDIKEIQSTDLREVCEEKVKEAYSLIKKPIIVEDTGAYLDELGGMPGPFIKFFEKSMGSDSLIKLLEGKKNRKCIIRTCISYYDGETLFSSIGEISGNIVLEAKKGDGFGFDCCFAPEEFGDLTYNELGEKRKNQISHRVRAIKKFKEDLTALSEK